MKWIKDEEFIRGSIPMTKFEARVLIMAMLELQQGDTFVDIGAGTGSLSIQAALLGAEVYAVEKEQEGVGLILQNAERFEVPISLIHGAAPEALHCLPVHNKCFIGGSGGSLTQIMEEADKRLHTGGILAASFIVPDNMVDFKRKLKELGYTEIEGRLIQSSAMDSHGLLKANNPIFIIKGKKL